MKLHIPSRKSYICDSPNIFKENIKSKNKNIYETKIKTFLNQIKTSRIKFSSLKLLFEFEDNFKLIYYLYQKVIKSKVEIEILNYYLKSLDNFISLLHSNETINELDAALSTINKNLKVRKLEKNNILFRAGDKGCHYYILLNGKANVLVPKRYNKLLTFNGYKKHLKILYILGEDYLLEQTLHNNIKICDFSYKDIDNTNNKLARIIFTKNIKKYLSYDDYINIINGNKDLNIDEYYDDNDEDDYIYDGSNNNLYEQKFRKLVKMFEKCKIIINADCLTQNHENFTGKSLINTSSSSKNLLVYNLENEFNNDEKINNDNYEVNKMHIGIPKELLKNNIRSKNIDDEDQESLPSFFGNESSHYVFYEKKTDKSEKTKTENNNDNNNNNNNNNKYTYARSQTNLIIVGYEKIGDLINGMCFGEISLLREDHLRTSTIYLEENSYIGRLNINEYNSTIKAIRSKIRNDSIQFLLDTKIFGDISYHTFLNKFWVYFQSRKISKGDFLFRTGDNCQNIYIIYHGEIKLSSFIDMNNIKIILDSLVDENDPKKLRNIQDNLKNLQNSKSKINKLKLDKKSSIFEKKQQYCLMVAKIGDILGLNDIVDKTNNTYICSGEVISEYLTFYEINKNILTKNYKKKSKKSVNEKISMDNISKENIEMIENVKKKFMINKLLNIKKTLEERQKFLSDDLKEIREKNISNQYLNSDDLNGYLNGNSSNRGNNSTSVLIDDKGKVLKYNSINLHKSLLNKCKLNLINEDNKVFSKNNTNKKKKHLNDKHNLFLSYNKIKDNKNSKIVNRNPTDNNTNKYKIINNFINYNNNKILLKNSSHKYNDSIKINERKINNNSKSNTENNRTKKIKRIIDINNINISKIKKNSDKNISHENSKINDPNNNTNINRMIDEEKVCTSYNYNIQPYSDGYLYKKCNKNQELKITDVNLFNPKTENFDAYNNWKKIKKNKLLKNMFLNNNMAYNERTQDFSYQKKNYPNYFISTMYNKDKINNSSNKNDFKNNSNKLANDQLEIITQKKVTSSLSKDIHYSNKSPNNILNKKNINEMLLKTQKYTYKHNIFKKNHTSENFKRLPIVRRTMKNINK